MNTRCSCGDIAGHCVFWKDVYNTADFHRKLSSDYPGLTAVTSNKFEDSAFSMIRDVRGWVFSTKRRSIGGYLYWYRHYRNLDNLVSYEKLVLRPEETLTRMCKLTGLSPEINAMLNYDGTEHHSIQCNRMKGDKGKMGKVLYDYRWMTEQSTLPALLRPVMTFNSDKVYAGQDVF